MIGLIGVWCFVFSQKKACLLAFIPFMRHEHDPSCKVWKQVDDLV